MMLPSKLLDSTQADIDRLIADKVREGPHLDFKRELPAAWDNSAKHELLADVTAFANAGGGDILYGVDETKDAEAAAIVPLVPDSVDVEVRRLQDFLLNLVEPRLPAVQVHAVPVVIGGVSGLVIVIRVPQSWVGPHRVKTNQHFFIRDGLRKRQLDVPELRGLFLRSENQAQRVRDFRADRLGKILIGETPCKLLDGPVLVVHVVPAQAALGLAQIDPVPYDTAERRVPMLGDTYPATTRLNLDGVVGILNVGPEGTSAYTQIFRTGFFETVWVLKQFEGKGRPVLPSVAYERYLNQLLDRVRADLSGLQISGDIAVLVSILRGDEVDFVGSAEFGQATAKFDRKTLVLPEAMIAEAVTVGCGMRTAYDLIWQSAGYRGSGNYDAAGEWAAQR